MIHCTFEHGKEALLRHVVVDVLVLKDDKILMVKRVKKLLEGDKWGIVGGYVEPDENLKHAAEREIFEETGYKVKDITLLTFRDNPDRRNEIRQNISFVFFCHALEKEGTPDQESTEQKWFSLDALPQEDEIAFDHLKNIQLYLEYKKNNNKLPILP